MNTLSRTVVFALVGALGFACQLARPASARRLRACRSASARPLAVLTAVAHNFLWHRGWTWRDRATMRASRRRSSCGLSGSTGSSRSPATSSSRPGLRLRACPCWPPTPSRSSSCSLANYVLADRLVFATASALLLTAGVADAAVLEPRTLAGWQEYVKATEQRIAREESNRSAGAPTAEEWRRLRAGALLLSSAPDAAPRRRADRRARRRRASLGRPRVPARRQSG